jgi:hypothetical protein
MTKNTIARYIALPIVSAGIVGGAALGLAGMANAATPTAPAAPATPTPRASRPSRPPRPSRAGATTRAFGISTP